MANIYKNSLHIILVLLILGVFNFIGYKVILFSLEKEGSARLAEQHQKVDEAASYIKSEVEFLLDKRLFAALGLKAFVIGHDYDLTAHDSMFENYARTLQESLPSVRSLQLAPDAIVTYVYPLEGNERAMGHNLLADDTRKTEVLRAIENNEYIVTGPLTLIQGGEALIARLPIYRHASTTALSDQVNNLDTFWGFATVIVDIKDIIDLLDTVSARSDVELSLRGKHALGAAGDVFYGSELLFGMDHASAEIRLPTGSWQLGILPKTGWYAIEPLKETTVWLSILLIALLNIILLALVREPYRLKKIVQLKTRQLSDLARFPQENPDPVLRIDTSFTIIYINEGGKNLLKSFHVKDEFVVPENFIKSLTLLLKKEGTGKFEWSEADVHYVVRFKKPAGENYINLYFTDVTQEKKVDVAKTEFVSLASHQLRTPLSIINWYTEALLKSSSIKTDQQTMEYVNEIRVGSQRMTELVNALLNVTRYELGTFVIEPEEINIKSFIQKMKAGYQQSFLDKNINISISVEKSLTKIKADKTVLNLILDNLISNAVKYSANGGKIRIGVTKAKKGLFCIEIEDHGYGIPDNQKSEVYKKMFRADNVVSKDTTGTGLGLYMVKSLVETVGGSISFVSTLDKGTTFSVCLPKEMKTKKGTVRFKSGG